MKLGLRNIIGNTISGGGAAPDVQKDFLLCLESTNTLNIKTKWLN
jgi:hypothetical protein